MAPRYGGNKETLPQCRVTHESDIFSTITWCVIVWESRFVSTYGAAKTPTAWRCVTLTIRRLIDHLRPRKCSHRWGINGGYHDDDHGLEPHTHHGQQCTGSTLVTTTCWPWSGHWHATTKACLVPPSLRIIETFGADASSGEAINDLSTAPRSAGS